MQKQISLQLHYMCTLQSHMFSPRLRGVETFQLAQNSCARRDVFSVGSSSGTVAAGGRGGGGGGGIKRSGERGRSGARDNGCMAAALLKKRAGAGQKNIERKASNGEVHGHVADAHMCASRAN